MSESRRETLIAKVVVVFMFFIFMTGGLALLSDDHVVSSVLYLLSTSLIGLAAANQNPGWTTRRPYIVVLVLALAIVQICALWFIRDVSKEVGKGGDVVHVETEDLVLDASAGKAYSRGTYVMTPEGPERISQFWIYEYRHFTGSIPVVSLSLILLLLGLYEMRPSGRSDRGVPQPRA